MTNASEGFCSSVIGTLRYTNSVKAMKFVLEKSKCHTLHRDNLRAQKDDCGIGMGTEDWEYAVDSNFNVTHWPYIHAANNYHCVRNFFSDSFVNMSLKNAILSQTAGLITLAAVVALF